MRSVADDELSGLMLEPWPLRVASALEEHHVCAWSSSPHARVRFVDELSGLLGTMEGSQVCVLNGARIVDLGSLCEQIESATGVGLVRASLGGIDGLEDGLRRRPEGGPEEGPALRRRYFVWTEAQTLLKHDPVLFGRVVDAMTGVAAEGEYATDDLLLLQRLVLVGAPAVDVYAEDPSGQLCRWYSEAGEDPLWRVVSGQAGPRVVRWRIEDEPAALAVIAGTVGGGSGVGGGVGALPRRA